MAPLFLGITLSHTHPEHCSDYTNSFLSGVSWPRESIIERTYIVYILFPGQELLFTKISHYYIFLQIGMPPPTLTSSFSVKREVIWGKASVCGYQHIGMFCQNIFKLSLPNKILFFFQVSESFYLTPEQWNCALWKDQSCVGTLKNARATTIWVLCSASVSVFSSDRLGSEVGFTSSDIVWEGAGDAE